MKELKLSKGEIEEMLKTMFDTTSMMNAGGMLTAYGFLLSDYIKARETMTPLQDVLHKRYSEENKYVH